MRAMVTNRSHKRFTVFSRFGILQLNCEGAGWCETYPSLFVGPEQLS